MVGLCVKDRNVMKSLSVFNSLKVDGVEEFDI